MILIWLIRYRVLQKYFVLFIFTHQSCARLDRMLVASWSRILAVVSYSSLLHMTKSSAYIAHFTGDDNFLLKLLMNTKKRVGDFVDMILSTAIYFHNIIHNTQYITNNKCIVMNREYIYDQCGAPHFTTLGLLPNDNSDLATLLPGLLF